MALPACFRLAEDVFPRVRALVARRLVAQGWSQTRAAGALGVSQTMVSRYVAAQEPPVDALVARLAEELERELAQPRPLDQPSSWCWALSRSETETGSAEALEDLLAAERLIIDAAPLAVMPQIGLNVARALPEAQEVDDVLSFPGRIVEAGGRLVNPVPPAFGSSGHLARCLLHLRARDPAVLALGSVRGGTPIAEAARRLGWDLGEVRRSGSPSEARPSAPKAAREHGPTPAGSTTDAEEPFHRAVARAPGRLDAVHDPGAFGIEPCLYVAAPSARAVAERVVELAHAVADQGQAP